MIFFLHPTTIIVAGPTQCGKIHFVVRTIKEKLIRPEPERIIWLYSFWQPAYEELTNVEFIKSTPVDIADGVLARLLNDRLKPENRNLLVLDDLMSALCDSADLSRLFTEGSHHLNLTVVYIVQNIFQRGKSQRTASLNTHYFIIFKNPRDSSQIHCLSRQICPGRSSSLVKIYDDITGAEPYSYLFIDCHPKTPNNLRFCTKIFHNEETFAYQPR